MSTQQQQTDNPLDRRLAFSEKDLDDAGILSRKTRYRLRRARRFPEPVVAGSRRLYRREDILEWLRDPEAWTPDADVKSADPTE